MSIFRPVLAFPGPKSLLSQTSGFELEGESNAIRQLRVRIQRIGPHFRTVLIRGEIGTGKELAARSLHSAGARANEPFIVCHAPALEEAVADGTAEEWLSNLIKASRPGTLFVDNIEEMPNAAQTQLLAALKNETGLRVISSTCADLRGLVASGRFRQDLYHRIATVEIGVPPLRERADDIALLAETFMERFSRIYGRHIHAIAEDALKRLLAHSWPGNVRELENVIRNAVLQCDGAVLQADNLTTLRCLKIRAEHPQTERLQEVIDRHVQHVLNICGGNKAKAAELLGISRSTLYRMLEGTAMHP